MSSWAHPGSWELDGPPRLPGLDSSNRTLAWSSGHGFQVAAVVRTVTLCPQQTVRSSQDTQEMTCICATHFLHHSAVPGLGFHSLGPHLCRVGKVSKFRTLGTFQNHCFPCSLLLASPHGSSFPSGSQVPTPGQSAPFSAPHVKDPLLPLPHPPTPPPPCSPTRGSFSESVSLTGRFQVGLS